MASEDAATDAGALTARARKLWQATAGELTADTVLSPDETYRPSFAGEPLRTASPHTMLAVEDRFELAHELGRGGMGIVFRARQPELHRDVAIKLLRIHGDAQARASFQAEVATMARLEHPGVVPVHVTGESPDGKPFLAMKLVDGKTWAAELKENAKDLGHQLSILQSVSQAVAFAHSRGIVHCDLKPSNIMLGSFGEVLIMDWGLAVSVEPDPALRHRESVRAPCGTPAYIAPELAEGRGSRLSPATDVYLLGAILCQLLRGTPPHSGRELLAAVVSALSGALPELPAEQPSDLRAICLKALSHDPTDRYPDAGAFAAALADHLRHHESASIASRARKRLLACQHGAGLGRNELYEGYTAAIAGFDQAQQLWPANPDAQVGLDEARHSYAEAALARGDLGLAAAQAAKLPGPKLRQTIAAAQRQREVARIRSARQRLALMAALFCLVAGLALGLWLVSRERNRAEEGRHLAQQALRNMMFGVRDQLFEHGTDSSKRLAHSLLQDALKGFHELQDLDPDAERTIAELVWAHYYIADTHLDLDGDVEGALEHLRAADALLETRMDQAPRPAYRFLQALVQRLRSRVAMHQGWNEEALVRCLNSVEILRELRTTAFRDALGGVRFDGALAEALGRLGTLYLSSGALDRADELFAEAHGLLLAGDPVQLREVLEKIGQLAALRGDQETNQRVAAEAVVVCQRALVAQPGWPREVALVRSLRQLGMSLSHHAAGEAEAAYLEALARIEKILLLQPENWELRTLYAETLASYAGHMREWGRLEEASSVAERSLQLQRELLADSTPDLTLVTMIMSNLLIRAEAGTLGADGEWATRVFELSQQLRARQDSSIFLTQSSDLPIFYARILLLQGKAELAWERYLEAAAEIKALASEFSYSQALQRFFSGQLRVVSRLAAERGEDRLALAFLDESEMVLTRFDGGPVLHSLNHAQRAELLLLSNAAEAQRLAAEAVRLARQAFGGADQPRGAIHAMLQSHSVLALVLEHGGDTEGAAATYREALELAVAQGEQRPDQILLTDLAQYCVLELARLHRGAGRELEAQTVLEVGLAAVERTLAVHPENQRLVEDRIMLLDRAAEQSLRRQDLASVLSHCQAARRAFEALQLSNPIARERLADLLTSAVQLAHASGASELQRALLLEQAVNERWLVDQQGSPSQRYGLAATLFNLSLLQTSDTAPAELELQLQTAAGLVSDQPESELALRINQQRKLVRQAALLDGWSLPQSAEDFYLLARGLEQRGSFDKALRAWDEALTLDAQGPWLLAASRCAAQAGAEAQVFHWLAETLAGLRDGIAAAETEAERANLRAVWQRIRLQDPAFEALRGHDDFEALFGAEDP